jgi:hypothetical protein
MAGEAPGVPSSSMILAPSGEEAQDRCALRFAAEHVVGADMCQQPVDTVGTAVDGDHRDPCVDHLLDDRSDPFVGTRGWRSRPS